MKTEEFIKFFENNGRRPVLCVANKEIFEDLGLEEGCKFYVVGFDIEDVYDGIDVVYEFTLDFSQFEEENKKFMSKSWYGRNTNELLYWYDTSYYPKDFRLSLYSDVGYDCGFDIFETTELYKKYINSGFSGPYVDYLEMLVSELSK